MNVAYWTPFVSNGLIPTSFLSEALPLHWGRKRHAAVAELNAKSSSRSVGKESKWRSISHAGRTSSSLRHEQTRVLPSCGLPLLVFGLGSAVEVDLLVFQFIRLAA